MRAKEGVAYAALSIFQKTIRPQQRAPTGSGPSWKTEAEKTPTLYNARAHLNRGECHG